MSVTAILSDIAPPCSSVRPTADDLEEPSADRLECKRDGGALSDSLITRTVLVEARWPRSRDRPHI